MAQSHPSTFSIVGHDPTTGEWGVAVASRFLAVGAVVPFARAGVGAVATQSFANTTYGLAGLELMAQGYSAQEALDGLVAADSGRDSRQAGFVDANGASATYTGPGCYAWASGRTGPNYAAQGNILAGPEVVDRMAETFEVSSGALVDRLVEALAAGQDAGGDSRGQQSAALLIVKARGGYGGFNDRYADLRVDDHPTPIDELRRILELHRLYFMETRAEDVLSIDSGIAETLQRVLAAAGTPVPASGRYDDVTREALRTLCGKENLEDRWREGDEIDRVVLRYLETTYLK
jgi:uncharacterized Ntn-hydrolase superfamily protein